MASKSNLSAGVKQVVLLYFTCIMSVIIQGQETHDTCGNDQYLTIKERLLKNYDAFDELYRLPSLAQASGLPKSSRSNDSFHIQGSEQQCAALQANANSQGGNTCPGQYVINRDVNRVPCVIKEFKCLCRRCLIPHSLQPRRRNSGCQPIYQYVPVMRRTIGLDEQAVTWSYVLEPVSVGCRCVEHRVMSAGF